MFKKNKPKKKSAAILIKLFIIAVKLLYCILRSSFDLLWPHIFFCKRKLISTTSTRA